MLPTAWPQCFHVVRHLCKVLSQQVLGSGTSSHPPTLCPFLWTHFQHRLLTAVDKSSHGAFLKRLPLCLPLLSSRSVQFHLQCHHFLFLWCSFISDPNSFLGGTPCYKIPCVLSTGRGEGHRCALCCLCLTWCPRAVANHQEPLRKEGDPCLAHLLLTQELVSWRGSREVRTHHGCPLVTENWTPLSRVMLI